MLGGMGYASNIDQWMDSNGVSFVTDTLSPSKYNNRKKEKGIRETKKRKEKEK